MPRVAFSEYERQEGKNFQCVIYPESESYDYKLLLERLPYFWDKFYYIEHDKDTYTEIELDKKSDNEDIEVGKPKKKHIHIVAHSESNLLLGRAAIKFGVPSNMVERCKSLKGSIQYLIHKNNPEKYQYGIGEIITNDDNLEHFIRNDNVSDKARKLIDFIYSEECTNLFSISNFAINNNCWDELRRGQHIYTALFRERIDNNECKNRRN